MFPLHARITKQRTGVIICVIWVVAAIVALPFLVFNEQVIIEWRDITETHCTDKWPRDETWEPGLKTCIVRYPTKKIYYTFVALTLYFLPVAIMTVAYFLIVWKLWRTKAPGERNIANIIVQHRAKKKVIKMVCVVLLGFVVCWTPMQVTVLYSQYGHSNEVNGTLPEWFDTLAYFSIFLAYSNSALNPILYGGFNANFREGVWAVLKCDYGNSFRRQNESRRSRATFTTGFTATVSSGRLSGIGTPSKEFELKTVSNGSHVLKKEPSI